MSVSTFDLCPVPKMKSTAMKHVEISGRQVVHSEEKEGADPDEPDVLANPPRIIVQCILM